MQSRTLTAVFATVSALVIACQGSTAVQELVTGSASVPSAPELRVGDAAPDFVLRDQNRQEVRLSDFRGRPVQLAFYVQALSSG